MPESPALGPGRIADRSLLVFVLFFLFYALGAARTVQGGDAGEFMTIAGRGGVAHPSGYPLVTLLMQAMVRLVPVGTVAWKASLASALCAALALAVLHRALVEATARPLAGWVAAIALGFSPMFWRYATVAEVFAGGALTGALVLLVAVRVERGWHGARAAAALGLAVATGVANHHSAVFLAPLAGYAFVRSLASPRAIVAHGVAGMLGVSVGLLPYAYLMMPGGAWRWGDTTTVRGVIDHFLRRDFGTLRLTARGAGVTWWEHPWQFLTSLPADFVGIFAVLAIAGVVYGVRTPSQRGLWAAVAASVVTAGPLFVAMFNVIASGMGLVVASRFYVLPHVLVAALAGRGAAALAPSGGRALALVVALGAGASALVHAGHGTHARWTVLEDYTRNVFAALEPNALFVTDSDSIVGATLYLQEVLGERPDVVVLVPEMQAARWYRDHIRRRHPDFEPASLYPYTPLRQVIANSLPVRPVYLTFNVAGPLAGDLPMYPESGLVMRVAPPDRPVPSAAAIDGQMDAATGAHLRRSWIASRTQWHGTWEGWVADEYAGAWLALAQRYGSGADADRVRRRVCALVPFVDGCG